MKKAILVVSFGTSHIGQLECAIEGVVAQIREEHEAYHVYLAFSSNLIIAKVKQLYARHIASVEEVLEQLKEEGYGQVIVQPLHLLEGKEFHKVRTICERYSRHYELKIGAPLFSHSNDYEQVVNWLYEKYSAKQTHILFVGHGTTHESDCVYDHIKHYLDKRQMHASLSTLDRIEYDANYLIQKQIAESIERLLLVPLMLVAGVHVVEEVMADKEGSWYRRLKQEGIDLCVITNGLGESQCVRVIFSRHIKEAKLIKI